MLLGADLIGTWWTKPRARYVNGVTYTAGVSSAGSMVVCTFNHAARTITRTVVTTLPEVDDHNNPALVVVAGKKPVLFYSRHNADDAMRYRIATNVDDVTAWDAEAVLTFGGTTTYAQVFERGNELHLFTRVGSRKWSYRRSTDWGATWGSAVSFIDFGVNEQIYCPMRLLADGKTLRVAATGHPSSGTSSIHKVYACLVDLETGNVTLPGSATVVGNLQTGTSLPLNTTTLQLVYDTPVDRTINIWDVSDGPEFEIAWGNKVLDDTTTTDAKYQFATFHAGAWEVNDIVAAGTIFGYSAAGMYLGSCHLPPQSPGGVVYLSREAAGVWYIEKRTTADRGGSWSTVLLESGGKMFRPWGVENAHPDLPLIFHAGTYGSNYQTSWLAGEWGRDDS